MGVILRQGFKHSLVTVIATVVGMINVLFIYTAVLSKDELGLFQYMINWGKFLTPFIALGMGAVATRFYPEFEKKSDKNNGLLFFLLLIPLLSFLLFVGLCVIFKPLIYQKIAEHSDFELLSQYLPYTILVVLAMLMINIFSSYTLNLKRIVVPEIFNNLWIKITVPLGAIAYFVHYLSFSNFIQWVTIAYFVAALGIFTYLWKLGGANLRPNWTYFDKSTTKEITTFASFTVLGGVGSFIATQIDTLMVGSYIDMENTAIYTIALSISVVVGIPLRSIFTITTPIIAASFNNNDLDN
ncbi:MAG: oligosaccharide flippase family protein, partial [Bacteroidota bacterium]